MAPQVRAQNLQELVYKQGQAGIQRASVSITFRNDDPKTGPSGYEDKETIVVTRQVGANYGTLKVMPLMSQMTRQRRWVIMLRAQLPCYVIRCRLRWAGATSTPSTGRPQRNRKITRLQCSSSDRSGGLVEHSGYTQTGALTEYAALGSR